MVGAVVGVVVLFALTLTLVVLTSGASRSRTSRQGSATGPELAWISYNTPDGTLRFDLPAQPDIVEADAQGNSTRSRYVVSVANASYSVSTHDYPQGFGGVGSEAWLNGLPAWFAEDVGGTVRTSSRTTVQRKPAIRYDVVGGDGRRWYVTDVFLGTRLLRLSVSGPDATTANLDHMAGSLAFLDPTAPATTTASPP